MICVQIVPDKLNFTISRCGTQYQCLNRDKGDINIAANEEKTAGVVLP